MRFGFDVSNYTAVPSPADFAALCNSERVESMVIACQFPETFRAWYDLARGQNIERIEAYGFLYDGDTPLAAQAQAYAAFLTAEALGTPYRLVDRLWLDCEETPGVPVRHMSELELWQALDAVNVAGYRSGIYTRRDYWMQIGNPQIGKYAPLWDVQLGNPRSVSWEVNYGGWLRATAIQYSESYKSYGMELDADVWEQ